MHFYHEVAARATDGADVELITEKYPPPSRSGSSLIAASVIMALLTTSWTVMRMASREIRKTHYYSEDYFYFVGQILYYGVVTCFILAVVLGGAGTDIGRLSAEHTSHYFRIALATQVLYGLCLGFVKVTVITMIRRIFRTTGQYFVVVTWILTAFCIIWSLYTTLLGFFICLPVASAWGGATPEKCGNQIAAYALVAILDIASEVIMVALPMKLVYDLQMKKAHKIALLFVFGAGCVTIVFSCVRLYYVYNIDFNNITRSYAEASISSVLQGGIAVIVASSPKIRPVFDLVASRIFGMSLRSSQKESSAKAGQSGGGGSSKIAMSGSRPRSHFRSPAYRPMSDSEEHLAWEMSSMERKSLQRKVSLQTRKVSYNGGDSRQDVENGHILVTSETIIERKSIPQ